MGNRIKSIIYRIISRFFPVRLKQQTVTETVFCSGLLIFLSFLIAFPSPLCSSLKEGVPEYLYTETAQDILSLMGMEN